MPVRGSSAGSGAAGSSSPGTRGRGHGRGAGLFAGVVDGMAQARRAFAAPSALDAVAMYEASPEVLEAIGNGFKAMGQTASDEIHWDPKAREFYDTLGDMILRTVDPARRGAAAIRRVERDRIEHAEEGGAKRKRWNVE